MGKKRKSVPVTFLQPPKQPKHHGGGVGGVAAAVAGGSGSSSKAKPLAGAGAAAATTAGVAPTSKQHDVPSSFPALLDAAIATLDRDPLRLLVAPEVCA